ncbi:uncharacterized protein LOC18443398 isoform X2 [Amborella trichopoda]|uniref:uncharacterized protein LOC18443398 isoform X2 n=1 Tax=Amborella trichopoda TaxID=13333 RepID=UPI0009BDD9ED|nr:uncharacterized protein LOC18443398 isoform X2 [Amborella trichopoda]|eukprot:XP_020528755.1 uncharacterized protein LOC18443398 isoform X2 [Amborella trichopoda]
MAPIAETFPNGYPSKTMITTLNPYNKTPTIKPKEMSEKTSQKKNSFRRPQKLSVEGLQRAVSDLSLELSREPIEEMKLPTISEVENAVCECCGLSEEYTTDYMKQVRERFCGKWVCGLCAEAVKEELQRLGEVSPTKKEEVSFTKEKMG